MNTFCIGTSYQYYRPDWQDVKDVLDEKKYYNICIWIVMYNTSNRLFVFSFWELVKLWYAKWKPKEMRQ